MLNNNLQCAFPVVYPDENANATGGLSKLEYFQAAAMQAFASNGEYFKLWMSLPNSLTLTFISMVERDAKELAERMLKIE